MYIRQDKMHVYWCTIFFILFTCSDAGIDNKLEIISVAFNRKGCLYREYHMLFYEFLLTRVFSVNFARAVKRFKTAILPVNCGMLFS